ncbi:hypothetical protein Tco_1252441 [Tanacetum coccineum]
MLHRLCRPPSIPLSLGLATVLPRRSVSRVSWAPMKVFSTISLRAGFLVHMSRAGKVLRVVIIEVAKEVMSLAEHIQCARHLYANCMKKYIGGTIQEYVLKSSKDNISHNV